MDEIPQLFTIKYAAKQIGMQYRQLLDAVNSGEIPHYRIGKGRRLVSISEVIRLAKCHGGTK